MAPGDQRLQVIWGHILITTMIYQVFAWSGFSHRDRYVCSELLIEALKIMMYADLSQVEALQPASPH